MPHSLVILRHATAEAGDGDDHARRLTPHGREQASVAGRRLVDAGVDPGALVLVSSAARTRETWDLARAAAPALPAGDETAWLYSAGPARVLDELRALPESVGSVVVVGHNPTVHLLAAGLPDDASALRGFAPGSYARLDVPLPWADLRDGVCTLTDHASG